MRLNKYLSDAGVCSRREADRLTEAGEITINGKRAETGMQVESGDVVVVKGKTVVPEEKKVYLAFNKPRGIVCTAEKREKNNVIDYLSYPVRIYPVGRLDKDSEALHFHEPERKCGALLDAKGKHSTGERVDSGGRPGITFRHSTPER